jgi:hypothetical protein
VKKTLLAAVLLAAMPAQPAFACSADNVAAAVKERWEVIKNNDVNKFNDIVADEYVLYYAPVASYITKNHTGARMKNGYTDTILSYDIKDLNVDVYNNLAVVRYVNTITGRQHKTNKFIQGFARTMEAWVCRDGRWQVVARQSDNAK